MTETLSERITINPKQCGGRPCIRGMRIRVRDVLDLFATGLSAEEILEEMPDLEAEDLQASLQYASLKKANLSAAFEKIQKAKLFQDIENPSEWQKKLRDEWK